MSPVRRPSPLPPPARSTDAPEPVVREPERMPVAPRREGAPAASAAAPEPADANATEPIEQVWHLRGRDIGVAPIIPFDVPVRSAEAHAGDAGGEAASESEPGRRWTAREVWAAARGRRRALRREVRRFTARQRRRRRIWLATGAAVVALVLGSIAAAYSPLFSVERITVVGTSGLDAAAVSTALSGQLGTPMPLVDESAIKAELVRFPLVESYSLEARPPHELIVRIVERTPIGAVPGDAGYTLVDAAGVALSTTPEPPAGTPLLEIQGGPGSAAFEAAGQIFRSLPESLRSQIATISATTPNDVTLTLSDSRAIVWGGTSDTGEKIRAVDRLMSVRPDAAAYDVSSPLAAVVR